MKPKRKTVYIERDGCNRRLLDLSKLETYLVDIGYNVVNDPQKSDLILLGTCAYKEKEEDKSVLRIKALKKINARLLIYGCLPDIAPAKFKEFSDLDFIAPKNIDKIDDFFKANDIHFKDISSTNVIKFQQGNSFFQRVFKNLFCKEIFTREFYEKSPRKLINIFKYYSDHTTINYNLFICRGCLGKCSYCAIKYAIGSVKSKPIDTVVKELKKGLDAGFKNIIILGDDPGCYGVDLKITFPDLLRKLLEVMEKSDNKKAQFNIDEIHPKWLIKYKDEFKEILKSKKITGILCPIQSGNDRVLDQMQREHTIGDLKEVIKTIQEINPGIKISTEIITGFPSETEEEYRETLEFVKDIQFDYTLLFPYHEKEMTPSRALGNKVPEDIIQKRVKIGFKYLRKNKLRVYSSCPY
ncbi:MAG: radical SAM protein [Candidatus Latescibacteria bacterium]|nr:radical SAM protein [Candidatus Latescibacterota bacterium]